jgi:hypothetical protein
MGHVMFQMLSIKECRLGFIAHAPNIVGIQSAARGKLCNGLGRQTVPLKKLLQLSISTLQHFDDLGIIPMVHGDGTYGGNVDAQPAVISRTLYAHQGAVTDGGPFGVLAIAIDAFVIAAEFLQEGPAGGGEGLSMIDVVSAAILVVITTTLFELFQFGDGHFAQRDHVGRLGGRSGGDGFRKRRRRSKAGSHGGCVTAKRKAGTILTTTTTIV